MHCLKIVTAATILLPTVGLAQTNNAQPHAKAKAWMVNNFDLVIKGVAVQDGYTYFSVQSSSDINEDGASDEGIVRLQCAKGKLSAAHYHMQSLRDPASGQTTDKRTHHPVTFVKEWGATTPRLYQVKVTSTGLPKITPKIAKESHGRLATSGWEPITLAEAETICVGREDARLESSYKGEK